MTVFAVIGVVLREGGGAACTVTSESSTNSLRLTRESIGTLLTASERSLFSLEVIHSDRWELGSGVVLRLILVDFVN
jgi:hypothetical protein